MKFTCVYDNKRHDYTPQEYGGVSNELQGNLCKHHWDELMEIKKRHNQEIEEWKNKISR